jgi:hypothetical protein
MRTLKIFALQNNGGIKEQLTEFFKSISSTLRVFKPNFYKGSKMDVQRVSSFFLLFFERTVDLSLRG